jgi:hypothetical protein
MSFEVHQSRLYFCVLLLCTLSRKPLHHVCLIVALGRLRIAIMIQHQELVSLPSDYPRGIRILSSKSLGDILEHEYVSLGRGRPTWEDQAGACARASLRIEERAKMVDLSLEMALNICLQGADGVVRKRFKTGSWPIRPCHSDSKRIVTWYGFRERW